MCCCWLALGHACSAYRSCVCRSHELGCALHAQLAALPAEHCQGVTLDFQRLLQGQLTAKYLCGATEQLQQHKHTGRQAGTRLKHSLAGWLAGVLTASCTRV